MAAPTAAPPTMEELKQRNTRTASFLALEGAEEYPKGPLMFILCMVALSEGADACLFPSNTTAITERGFDIMNLGVLSTIQAIFQAFGGPFWGVVASNVYLERKTILVIGTVCQGLATVVMCIWLDIWIMGSLRCVNGFMLAALRPIANSIVGDRFNDNERGRYFGMIMTSMSWGGGAFGWYATSISNVNNYFLGIAGWRFSFIAVGVFTMALGPLIHFGLQAPSVKLDPNHKGGLMAELQVLRKLLQMWTFAGLVLQGCFGLIPWRAFEYRTFFFQKSGVSDSSAGFLNAIGQFTGGAGNFIGGAFGDVFGSMSPTHGRIAVAWVSVFGGIPVALCTYIIDPPSFMSAVTYFGFLVVFLGLVATWSPAACNSPLLCSIASERERSLVLAWQTSLEGAVGALGSVAFTWLLTNVFGVNSDCLKKDPPADADCTDIAGKAGRALFFTSCVPWLLCGSVYMSLHFSYPKDLARAYKAREEEQELALRTNMF